MTTKEVAQICGVSIPTVTENAKKVGIIFENGKVHEWTEEELKKVQVQLMKNTTARGNATTSGRVVEETALNALKGGERDLQNSFGGWSYISRTHTFWKC